MNIPPVDYQSVSADALHPFVASLFAAAGMTEERAAFLADLLVKNDLRGVVSHGTQQVRAYVDHFRKEQLTPNPTVTTVQESPATLVLDGGGGLGYFACHEAANRLVPKARELGVAVATTRNHGHFGAAGIYARVIVEAGLFAYITSGHQLRIQPGDFVMKAAGGSPMCFGIPTGEETPFLLDFGAVHDLYVGRETIAEIMEKTPSMVIRSFGMGCACQALGGLLCGLPLRPEEAQREWPGANQGSFMIAVDLARLLPPEQFHAEMDAYVRAVREMTPLPGLDMACLPGGVEEMREKEYAEKGIPVGTKHAQALQQLADDYGLTAPFARPDAA